MKKENNTLLALDLSIYDKIIQDHIRPRQRMALLPPTAHDAFQILAQTAMARGIGMPRTEAMA